MRAILYARVSSTEQAVEGVSLAAQEAKMRAYCELYGVEVVEIIVDAGQSAKTLNRPGLQQALGMLEAGSADGLVIARLDRLTRSVADWALLIEQYFSKRFGLMSVSDQIDTRTASGRMVTNLLICIAQWERETIGERTATALAHLKASGMHVGGIPYGHEIRDGKLLPLASHADAISLMTEMRAEGATLQAIADKLNEMGIPTARGGKWYPMTVKNVLARAA